MALLPGMSVSPAALARSAVEASPTAAIATAPKAPQSASPSVEDPVDIVVTLRLRNEKPQDAPMMVAAFSAQRLKDNDVRDVSVARTPNVRSRRRTIRECTTSQ
jgi:outer membrane receptor protein involved in Fe transport